MDQLKVQKFKVDVNTGFVQVMENLESHEWNF